MPTKPLLFLLALWASLHASVAAADQLPIRVAFPSLDGKTTLTGYLFEPVASSGGKRPAVVMMHGRAGAYSSKANGRYDASTLSMRHAFWGRFWADRGIVALLVDGFGPRGFPHGFPAHSYEDRPVALSEVDVRPLDAYGALGYLRSRGEVDGGRVILQGWSNGGSATVATMSDETLLRLHVAPDEGFRAAIAFYPACGLHGRFQQAYRPYAPLRIFSGDADEEVSAKHCARLVEAASLESDLAIEIYPGAEHDFDDPGRKRQGVPANAAAAEHAVTAVWDFVQKELGR